MAQEFKKGMPLVDGHGNFGSIEGDGAAAMRYTEARLQKVTQEAFLADLDKDVVDFGPNFDETEKEPSVLPVRVPNLLLNGADGIAVGMATSIPPHNLCEIVDAVKAYMKNNDITVKGLMKYIKGPDFPTGGIVVNQDDLLSIYEKGVGMAGLNFVGNAYYHKEESGKKNVASFEFIPWVLAQCATLDEVRELIADLNIVDTPFSENLPSGMLHWIISDKRGSITVESMKDGLHIHENPVGVLTNNPPFEQQMFMLNNYMGLSPKQPENHFTDKLDLNMYSRGMGALGLPGDLSSASRFARVAFTKMNAVSDDSEEESVAQFFHILGSVDQQRGCCEVSDGKYEITIYTSCCNASRGIYYYTTYSNSQITAVDMHREDLDGSVPVHYPMLTKQQILWQN